MATNWKAQIGEGKYSIQFETTNYNLYRIVEKACQKAVDNSRSGKVQYRERADKR